MRAMRAGLSRYCRSLPGQVTGAGLAGAALGTAVAGIWNASWTSTLGCPRPTGHGVDDGICFPVGLWLLAITVNFLLILAGVWAAFTVLRLGPRGTTVPGGCVVMLLMVMVSGDELGLRLLKTPPVPWVTALESGAALAAFALIAAGGRVRLAGVLALAVTLAAAVQLPPLIRQHEQTEARLHDLEALGFPLEVPHVPGYRVTAADVSNGVLTVAIDLATPHPDLAEILVNIGPADGAWAAQELAACTSPGREHPLSGACAPRGPHRWLLTNASALSTYSALAENAGLVTESSANGDPSAVSVSTLFASVTSLQPASAASLAGLGG